MSHEHEQATRTSRANAALSSEAYIVTAAGRDRWDVIGREGDAYIVTRDRARWTCTCPDHAEMATTDVRCKHIEVVRLTQHEDNMMDQYDWLKRLTAPFYSDEVQWRVGVKPKKEAADPSALLLPYIDARTVMNRLDDVVGPLNWQVVHAEVNGQMVTSIGIRNPETGDWIWKGDSGYVGGSDSNDEDVVEKSVKGTPSDGLKRAAVQWGIGRYLYDLPNCWLKWEWTDDAKTRGKPKGHPVLPPFALPTEASVSGFEHNIYLGRPEPAEAIVKTTVTPKVANPATGELQMSAAEKAVAEAKTVLLTATFKNFEGFRGQTLGAICSQPQGRELIAYLAQTDPQSDAGKRIKAAALLLNVPEGMR